ncbi:DUF2749 domain-containing protein [Rhizobium binxianense]
MSRLYMAILVLSIIAAGALFVQLLMPTAENNRTVEAPSPGSQMYSGHQQQVREFFGGKKAYDLNGGQEIRPRW